MPRHQELTDKLEDLMSYYSKLSASASTDTAQFYFEGIAEGLNKAWKLLDGEPLEDVKT